MALYYILACLSCQKKSFCWFWFAGWFLFSLEEHAKSQWSWSLSDIPTEFRYWSLSPPPESQRKASASVIMLLAESLLGHNSCGKFHSPSYVDRTMCFAYLLTQNKSCSIFLEVLLHSDCHFDLLSIAAGLPCHLAIWKDSWSWTLASVL